VRVWQVRRVTSATQSSSRSAAGRRQSCRLVEVVRALQVLRQKASRLSRPHIMDVMAGPIRQISGAMVPLALKGRAMEQVRARLWQVMKRWRRCAHCLTLVQAKTTRIWRRRAFTCTARPAFANGELRINL
jgi:hypothetical protein